MLHFLERKQKVAPSEIKKIKKNVSYFQDIFHLMMKYEKCHCKCQREKMLEELG